MKALDLTFGKPTTIRITEDSRFGKGLWLEFNKGYEFPNIGFEELLEVSEFFGTKTIEVDEEVLSEGCETCGYGSNYEKIIKIYRITKNLEYLE